jgi:hypothetical protein
VAQTLLLLLVLGRHRFQQVPLLNRQVAAVAAGSLLLLLQQRLAACWLWRVLPATWLLWRCQIGPLLHQVSKAIGALLWPVVH